MSKSNKKLNEIHDPWLINQIIKYEFIAEQDFNTFSNIANYQQLFDSHYELFKEVFFDHGIREQVIFN